ncbi:MAG: prolyl oligopeptidase family serine peptidase, partial [Bacteroidota bacterium]
MNSSSTSEVTLPGNPSLPSSPASLQTLVDASTGDFPYSVEDFFRLPEKAQYRLSPDGRYFSFLGQFERRQNIFIQEIGSDKATRITSETDRNIASYFWANNNRLLFVKDSGGDENFQLHAVDKDGQNARDLTPFEKVRINLIDALEEIEEEIIIGMNKNNPQLFEPYRMNINTGDYQQLANNDDPAAPIDNWVTDHDGKLRLASRVIGTNTTLLYRDSEVEAFQEVFTTDFRISVEPLFFEFDNSAVLYASSNRGRDKSAIVRIDLRSGEEIGEPLFSHPEVDVEKLGYSKKRKVLTYISYNTSKQQYHFLDDQRAQLQKRLEGELAGYEIVIPSMNKAEDKYMIRTYSDRSLGAYYCYDQQTDQLEKIAEVSPWIEENDMCTMTPIQYTSRDGLTINGYLTLPSIDPPRQLPVVVNPHGGPWARDSWGFNPEVQLLASRGYAILQMNFRGSTGYGRSFWESSFQQWGRSMQDDITDGVQWLIDQEIADPKRIAIYGGSYGGYATLAGVTFTPDLY